MGDVPSNRCLRRQNSQRDETRRSSDRAAHEIRAGRQSQNREGDRDRVAHVGSAPRRRGDRVRRRHFITLLGGAAAAWPLAGRAQQAGRTYRLGVLHNQGPQSPQLTSFYDELRRLGFVEGQNLIVDSRGYAVRTEQFPAVAAELVKAQVDAILAGGAAAARAAQAATRMIPILTLTDDMVGQGLVASLARPGGNTTGISILATELDGKRQEILMEMVPAARRMAVLADANTAAPQNMRTLQEAAGVRGVELAVRLVERPERIVPEIEEARRAGAEALNVLASPILYARRLDIFERTAALRLPTMYQSPEFAEEGGLIGYGPRITLMFRQLARQLAKVFSGEKASDVPVEQPTTFELAINLQAAKGIGFEVPPSLVLRAEKVIE